MWNPTFLEVATITEIIYYNEDESLWLWKDPTSGKWTISATLLAILDVDGSDYTSDYRTLNSEFYYERLQKFVWKNSSRWRFTNALGFEDVDDAFWWESPSANINGTYQPEGTATGTKTVAIKTINGWEADNLFDEYDAIAGGGASGKKYVGWKRLSGNEGLGNLDQSDRQQNSQYIFLGSKNLWYDGSNWIINNTIGTKDATVGYWQGGTPPNSNGSPVAYNRVYTGDTPPSPSSYTVSFDSFIAGDSTSDAIQGQIAVFV